MRYWGQHRYRIPLSDEAARRIERFKPYIGKAVLTEALLKAHDNWVSQFPTNGAERHPPSTWRLKVKLGTFYDLQPGILGDRIERALEIYESLHQPVVFRPGARLKRLVYLPAPLLTNLAFSAVTSGRHIDDDLGNLVDFALESIIGDTAYWNAEPQEPVNIDMNRDLYARVSHQCMVFGMDFDSLLALRLDDLKRRNQK